ncbi:MAG TPA: TatD family hydrolase, partial [Deltaproteobacteria bacterium]|nr:TatD family hydrolase [Deltaproteobacteria bacterium]
IIHDREAHDRVFSILRKMGKREKQGVIHCFSGDVELAHSFIDLGYYISIPGTVTYKKASVVKDVAAVIPLERMLVETDAPFLAPAPRRGKRNEPAFVEYTAREIAKLRNISFEEVAIQTSKNAEDLFGLT